MWDDLEAAVDIACEDDYGSRFRFIPMTKAPSERAKPDDSRTAFEAPGIFRRPNHLGGFSASREAMESGKAPGIQGTAPGLGVRAAVLSWVPVPNDRVIRLKDGKTFSIVKVEPFGTANLDIILAETAS